MSESYKHQAAKHVLKRWIDERPALLYRGLDRQRWPNLDDVMPCLLEFPISNEHIRPAPGGSPLKTYAHTDENGRLRVPQPSFDELEGAVYAILDVGVVDKANELTYGFEIVHRCPVSDHKAVLLDSLSAITCEVSAEWILCQVDSPAKLQINRIFGYGFWAEWCFEYDDRIARLGGAAPPPGLGCRW